LGADFLKERESFKENKKILLLATLVFFIALSAIFGLLEMKGSINDLTFLMLVRAAGLVMLSPGPC